MHSTTTWLKKALSKRAALLSCDGRHVSRLPGNGPQHLTTIETVRDDRDDMLEGKLQGITWEGQALRGW